LRYHTKDNFLWYKICLKYFPADLPNKLTQNEQDGQIKDWMKIFRQLCKYYTNLIFFFFFYKLVSSITFLLILIFSFLLDWKRHKIIFAEKIKETELKCYGWLPKLGQFSDIKV
jgi:predicted PurR-regulated permease PerM